MKRRINILCMILTVITILETVALSATVFYGVLTKEVIQDLRNSADVMVESDAWQMVSDPANVHMENTPKHLRITLINPDGNAVCDSDADVRGMGNHKNRPEIASAFSKGEGKAVRNSQTLGKSAFYYAVRLDNGYVLRISKEVSSMTGILLSTVPRLVVLSVLLFAACVILSHALTKSIVKPIEELAKNLEGPGMYHVYEELEPYVTTIRAQHEDIIRNANMRQEFTANVSHELKTPLMSISGYAELMMNGMVPPDKMQDFSGRIFHESERLSNLVADIIQLSRLDEKNGETMFEQVDIGELGEDVINNLQNRAAKKKINLEYTGGPAQMQGVRHVLYEMFYNITDNAIRYTPDGGDVKVFVGKLNGKPYFRVEDNGIGIPESEQQRIFERFYRVDKSHSRETGGTGLGLSIVKHGAVLHHAKILLDSEPGKGTKMEILFDQTIAIP